ncbi:HD domain-containing protein [uncultured Ilyobacter sp.]|uniref:Ppx/GppA phosphatase family protein n=1 Tax=uncultured Ilyobacter sp. TaxID=544433 RepID=UPI0029C67E16|nr:HD domain-containing protein [uncultured Ilyobacter sp.]
MPVISVIEISPTSVEMIICEKSKDNIKVLENVNEELNIFLDSEKNNYISYEKGKKLCNILNRMKSLSKDYGVKDILTVTTSSVNSVKNLLFILDQIKIKVGLEVTVLTSFEKKKLLFKKFLIKKNEIIPPKKNTLLLNIGSATTDFFVINGKKLMINEFISTGGYKFAEIINNYELTPKESTNFIQEYIENYLNEIKKEVGRKKIDSLILLGESENIFTKTKGMFSNLSYEKLEKTMEDLSEESFKNITQKYSLTPLQSITTFARLSLLKYIAYYFEIPTVKIFYYDTKYLMAYEHFFPKEKENMEKELWELTVQAVIDKASKFTFDKNHSTFVQKVSKDFFDALKPLHNMLEMEKRHLELAAFLHDIGKYINFSSHQNHSQYIITNSFIPGLTEKDLEVVGLLCYFHNIAFSKYSENIDNITGKSQMDIMKLAAILKVSVALDRSKRQKVKNIKFELKDHEIIIDVTTQEDYRIETIFFDHQKTFFRDVFGINPVLKVNRRLYGD